MIPRLLSGPPIGGKTGLKSKMYPNGECVVYKPKTFKMDPLVGDFDYDPWALGPFLVALWGHLPPSALGALAALGSSPHLNFDKILGEVASCPEGEVLGVSRYGRNGITSYGARRVRNACYLLENAVPKMCTVFATCTVPAIPLQQMRCLHEGWNKVVEAYRRKLTRRLRDEGLSGESVTVSEIQGKRYERTGMPVLHIHTVFNGRRPDGKPAVTTEQHDKMWAESLVIALGDGIPDVSSACNLQWVKKSAQGYLGKYMSKGSKAVRKLAEAGFEGWLPKQWWGLSRSLGERVDNETRQIDEFAEWLNDVAGYEGSDVWDWHRDVQIEMASGDKITIARYGKVNIRHVAQIRMYYLSQTAQKDP